MSTPRHLLAPLVLGWVLTLAVRSALGQVPAVPGEPPAVRWLRKLAEHPGRGGLALGLLALALGPERTSEVELERDSG